MFIYPMAAFARIVAEDPSLHTVYGTDAMELANAAMETMWVFMPDFKIDHVGSYVEGAMYRLKTVATDTECEAAHKIAKNYLTLHSGKTGTELKPLVSEIDDALKSCKENHLFADKPFAHNESMSLVMSFIELWRALDSSFYQTHEARASDAGLARALIPLVVARQQRYFVNRLKLIKDDDEGERYSWLYNDDVPVKRQHNEDTSHGNLDMLYLYVLQDSFDRLNAIVAPFGEPIPLDNAILRRFANTFLQKIARPDTIDGGGDLACDVNGRTAKECKKDPWAYNNLCYGWGNLASVDATVYRVCHVVSLRTSERGGKRDHRALQNDLNLWNHSTLLATKRFSRQVTALDLTSESGSPPAASNPFGWVYAAQDTQNVVFRGTDGHAYELWRTASGIGYTNLSGPAGAPRVKGDPKGYEFPALGRRGSLATHNVVYRGTDDRLHLLHWTTEAVTHEDLTALSGAPKPAGDPFPYVSPFGVQNVVYRGTDGHLHVLYWTTVADAVSHYDLTARSGAPKPDGDPFGYFINSQGLNHVVYRGKDHHLHGTYWTTGEIFDDDLTSASGAPAPAGDPTAYETPAGLQNVVYRGTDGRLHGLYWTGAGEVGHDDLSNAVSGAPLPADDPTAYFNAQDGTHHMIYRTGNGHLHELSFTTGAVTHTDLSTVVPAPPSEGKEASAYVFAAERTQHVIFRAKNGQLHDLSWGTPIIDGPGILTPSLPLFDNKR